MEVNNKDLGGFQRSLTAVLYQEEAEQLCMKKEGCVMDWYVGRRWEE